MPSKNSFTASLEKQAADRKRLLERLQAQRARRPIKAPVDETQESSEATLSPKQPLKPKGKRRDPAEHSIAASPPISADQEWKRARVSPGSLELFNRQDTQKVDAQPWTRRLVDRLLEAAEKRTTHLVLVWPVRLDGLALLHARANWERVLLKDLKGLRTGFYPGSLATRNSLQTTLLSRTQLSNMYRKLWETNQNGTFVTKTATESSSVLALLKAINDVRVWSDDTAPQPSFAEVTPSFLFAQDGQWSPTGGSALERTVRKVQRKSWRDDLRGQLQAEWTDSKSAPGALFVLHNALQKSQLKAALSSPAIRGICAPEVFLFDATSRASAANHAAVRRIPEFVKLVTDRAHPAGSLIVTDDPRTFFATQARLRSMGIAADSACFASEGDEPLFSNAPFADDWQPATRSLTNFEASIVDQPASHVALALQRLAQATGVEESPEHRVLMEACLFVLRLSNMPAGYADLESLQVAGDPTDFATQRNAWGPLRLRLDALSATGALSGRRADLHKAIARAEDLVSKWTDATPMAERLLTEVERQLPTERNSMSIVVPSGRYVSLAQTFLKRRLGAKWEALEPRIEWHTLYSVGKTLSTERKRHHFVFIGVNADVLRVLLTHPAVPHGTTVFMAFKQANSVLMTLAALQTEEAFKPYRGRIGLFAQELNRRLRDMPNPPDIGRIGEFPLTFNFTAEHDGSTGISNQAMYKFELDDGGTAYASGTVYQYVPDEDPVFRRVQSRNIIPGHEIFEMDDDLRVRLEQALNISGGTAQGIVSPLRMLMRLYRQDVQNRCRLFFGHQSRPKLAQAVHTEMVTLNGAAEDFRPSRIEYWLDLGDEGDTRPHAPNDSKFFKLFCQALQMTSEQADQYWLLVKQTRNLNQNLGRELSARYAEILFQPESAVIYRGVSRDEISRLQAKAVQCVRRVLKIHPPVARTAPQLD